MKVTIIRSTIANGKDLFKGKSYDLDTKLAKKLILLGKAKEARGKK